MKKAWKWIKHWFCKIIGRPEHKCRECGRTDLKNCVNALGIPCSWVEDDLCSKCALFVRFYRFPWHTNPLLNYLRDHTKESTPVSGDDMVDTWCYSEMQKRADEFLRIRSERRAVKYGQD